LRMCRNELLQFFVNGRLGKPREYSQKFIRVNAKNHFRMMQAEAVLSGWSMKRLRARQSRSVNSSGVRAM
jgi:hypothetical protein